MSSLKKFLFGEENMPEQLVWLQRRETWSGDTKANFIRICALGFFAVNEFFNYHVLQVVDRRFHIGSLLVIFIWFLAAIIFNAVLKNHWLPKASSYIAPAVDSLLLTWLLFLGDGPRSPLVAIYFLVIALAGLRLNAKIVLYTCLVCAFGYFSSWDFAKHQKPMFLVPIYHLVIMIVSMGLAGLIVSSLINRVFDLFGTLKEEKARG